MFKAWFHYPGEAEAAGKAPSSLRTVGLDQGKHKLCATAAELFVLGFDSRLLAAVAGALTMLLPGGSPSS